MEQLSLWPQIQAPQKIINVATVKHLSPFRYPGGKTWLVPYMRQWLAALPQRPYLFVEPFAGGAIISLTVASEQLAEHVLFVELDEQVAAVWQTILSENADWLCQRILTFELTPETADEVLAAPALSVKERAFQTILRNRINHGGILAPGAGRIRKGENGKGIRSRWYPKTLCKRIRYIHDHLHGRLTFVHGDGMAVVAQYAEQENVVFFIDPPYTTPGKSAGTRLYLHHELDHENLFDMMSRVKGHFLMTYENSPYVRALAVKYGFEVKPIAMKNTHHAKMTELLISKRFEQS